MKAGDAVDIKAPESGLGTICGRGVIQKIAHGQAWVKVTHRGIRPAPVRDGEVILYPVHRLVSRGG